MVDIHKVNDTFAVAGQIAEHDVKIIADSGYRTIIANRPDGEGGVDQPRMGIIRTRAESLGVTFVAIPFSGTPSPDILARMRASLEQSPGPVLAYCRTGMRSITAWALIHAGKHNGATVLQTAMDAGYDLRILQHRFS